ncbi:unknown protein encoded by cryptic prophage CP-933M [Escherichia coli O157:H7 str. EDL933]|uniref:HNH domain-containing protein n=1 Tax=Escherichia coli O157:H7 TaxID=83334 RepID=Q8X4H9_ECO57|nr:unknown protein encoded by cryptic prophage CP-933M [Escherichia coli O157:H7 str. EDL933]
MSVAVPGFPSNVVSGGGMPDTVVSVDAWLTFVTSELDHRIALQFGGGNEETNLWTLCTECHRQKSASEAASGMPDPTLPELPDGTLRADGITGL